MHNRSLIVYFWNAMKPRPQVSLFVVALLLAAVAPLNCSYEFAIVENNEPDELIGYLPFNNSGFHTECAQYLYTEGNQVRAKIKIDREAIEFDDNSDDILYCTYSHPEGLGNINIKIFDVNDNVPHFEELEDVHTFEVAENFNIPNPIVAIQPVDGDNGPNGTVEFNITAGNTEGYFYIDQQLLYEGPEDKLQLFFNHSADYEVVQHFNLTITIHDFGSPRLKFDQVIIIDIINVKDEPPTFISSFHAFDLLENQTLGPEHPFGTLHAVIDEEANINDTVYSLLEGELRPPNALDYIAINNMTGELYLIQAIDYEVNTALHEIELRAAVQEVGSTYFDITVVQIFLIDINDVPPLITIRHYPTVVENNGFFILFRTDDTDGISRYEIELHPPLNYTTFNSENLYSIMTNEAVDREQAENVTVNITVYDNGVPQLATTEIVVLPVHDVNDNSPTFVYTDYSAIVGDNAPLGKVVTTVQATDPDSNENSFISYEISSISPYIAESWFSIDSLTGVITVNESLNYSLADSVSLIIKASDNGTTIQHTTNTTVYVSISPAITFKPWSYQEHCLPKDIKLQDTSTTIYLEFRTNEKNGLLMYEESVQGEQFFLGIENGELIVQHNQLQSRFNEFDVSTNHWITVVYDFEKKTLNVTHTDQEEEENSKHELTQQAFELVRCDSDTLDHTFFLGGIDVFSHSHQNLSGNTDFVGTIRNVIIDSVRVDMAFPLREVNTVRGILFTSEPMCSDMEVVCSGPHYAGCLDYDLESHCICSGGFNPGTCDEEKNYSPIQFSSSSNIKLVVNYAMFVNLLQHSEPVLESSDAISATVRSSPSVSDDTSTYQFIEFQFRLLRDSTGTVLYSRTQSAIHNLQIEGPSSESSNEYSIRYIVTEVDQSTHHLYIHERFSYVLGDIYTVAINMTADHTVVSFNGTMSVEDWINTPALFVEHPYTEIIIGGIENSIIPSDFTGCVTRLTVNGIEFPLNGLVENKDSSILISGDAGSSSVSTICDLCQQETPPCQDDNMICINHDDSYTCECEDGLELSDEGECIKKPTIATTSGGLASPPDDKQISLYYIIAGAAGAPVAIAVIVSIICCVCCRRRKQRKQEKTYHVGGDQQLPRLGSGVQSLRQNSYSDVPIRRSSVGNSERGSYMTVSRHQHESSMSTSCNEHDIDEDTESNTQNMTRSKSSTSGETGFHTASEREDQRSLPRMDDSGNEKETDYSPFDTESDGSQSYVDMHHPQTSFRAKGRPGMLQPFSSGSSRPTSGVGAPLTPKEKKFIIPLRPDSRSELGEETDLDTDFSSTVFTRQNGGFSRGYRGGSLKLPGRPDSGMSGHQWYKESTYSDTERERKRAERSHAYYPPNQFQSFRRTRATSASSAQPSNFEHVRPQKSCSSLTPPRTHTNTRSTKRDIRNNTPPISPLTNHNQENYHHHTLPSSHTHKKNMRNSPKTSDASEFSTSVLSRTQIHKMQPPFLRQCSDSPRVPAHLAARPYVPSYMRSFSEESSAKEEKKFVDLGSMRTTCDPIQYWEGQRRMMSTVDQVDAYPVLSESFTPFEDSTVESQQSGPEHQSFSSQGGGEATAEALDMGLLRDCDTDSVATGTTLKGSEAASRIMFPSADCSEEYRCSSRLVSSFGTSSTDNNVHHSCTPPPSQGTFEV